MSPTSPSERYASRFALAFAEHWGLEVEPLRHYLVVQLKRISPAELDDEAAVSALLTRPAMEYRNSRLRPILQDLFDWLRARVSHRFGLSCHAFGDDAVSQTMMLLLGYWKPWWSRPEGQEHLRRYAMVAVAHTTFRILRGEKAHESRLPPCDDAQDQPGPESLLIQQAEEQQRALAHSRLHDLDWLLEAGLTRAEANAVVRFLGPDPTNGLDQRAEAAWRKALQRAKARLRTMVDQLREDGASRPAGGSPTWCDVEYLGLRGRFQVIECSAGELWLEGPVDDASLEIGGDCLVHIHSNSAVIARGARCVRIEQAEGRVRIALEFLFRAHRPYRAVDTQPTL